MTFTAPASAGTYTLTVTAASFSKTHTASATLVVAPDFSFSASPSLQTVQHGGSTTYSVSVTPSIGFSGTVALSVSGLPKGATASFSPASISASGSSTMTVGTSKKNSTPTGSYTLTISGKCTSPALMHTTTVTLIVN